MCRQPDAILFDLDGVIVDSRTAITRCINHALAAHGLSPRAEEEQMIGAALEALDADRAVMVGDRSFDIVGAHAHGLAAVGVTWGIGSVTELTSAGADAIVADPAELPAVAGRLLLAQLEATHRAA